MTKHSEEVQQAEQVVEMDVGRLKPCKDHPFKVAEDQQMLLLKESIEKVGILNPLIVRPVLDGYYEIISGHRRCFAAKLLGYRKVPVIIRVLKDEDAVIEMVDSNLHREHISPSEKAFAYKMKNEALKRKQGRKKKDNVDHEYTGKRTVQIIAETTGESVKQVQRFIKLTDLNPDLLQRLDEGKMSFSPSYEIAYLSDVEQRWVIKAMSYSQASPSLSQAQRLKELSKKKELTLEITKKIMSETKKGEVNRVVFKNEQLHQFFPKSYSAEMMKAEILAILKLWTLGKADDNEKK